MKKLTMIVLMAMTMVFGLSYTALAGGKKFPISLDQEKIFTGTITAPIAQSNLRIEVKGSDPGFLYYRTIETGIPSDWVKDLRLIKEDIPSGSVTDPSTEIGWSSLEYGYRSLQINKDGRVRILLASEDDGRYHFDIIGDYKLIIKYQKPWRKYK